MVLDCTPTDDFIYPMLVNLSVRKLRLLACACIRTKWHKLTFLAKELVEKVESYVDGKIDLSELETLSQKFIRMEGGRPTSSMHYAVYHLASYNSSGRFWDIDVSLWYSRAPYHADNQWQIDILRHMTKLEQ